MWKIKDLNGNVLEEKDKVKERYKEYFQNLLNVESDRPVDVSTLGMNASKIGTEKMGSISDKEIMDALKKMKSGKSAGVDGILPEMLKAGGSVIVKWFKRLANVCMDEGEVPQD